VLKTLGSFALGACIIVAICAASFLFLRGAVWASEHLLEPLIRIGWWVLAADVLLALPLSIFRRTRVVAAVTLLYSSFVYGLIAWLTGFVITYNYWGVFGVVMGLFFGGVGVVPFGLLASAFHGRDGFVPLLALIVLTFGSRIVAFLLAASAEKYEAARPDRPLSEKEQAEAMAAFESLIDRSDSHKEDL
jgi:hypothetical protein